MKLEAARDDIWALDAKIPIPENTWPANRFSSPWRMANRHDINSSMDDLIKEEVNTRVTVQS